jgi:uncharacterized membrane protein YgcG
MAQKVAVEEAAKLRATLARRDQELAVHKVRKTPSWPRRWANTSAFYSCIPIEMFGPTYTFWANLTLFSLKRRNSGRAPEASGGGGNGSFEGGGGGGGGDRDGLGFRVGGAPAEVGRRRMVALQRRPAAFHQIH